MKLSDVLALTVKGYKIPEIKEIETLVKEKPENESDIIELAKKVNFPDLKEALAMAEDHSKEKPEEQKEAADNKAAQSPQQETVTSSNTGSDDVDYKKLYEDEKKLRESLQNSEARKPVEDDAEKLSDYDRALQIVADVLN